MRNSRDLLNEIQSTLQRLRDGDISVDEAHAETRLYDQVSKLMAISLEHARLTNRFAPGSRTMPTFDLGDPAEITDAVVKAELPNGKGKKLIQPRTGEPL